MKMLHQYETPVCIFTLFKDDSAEYWHCGFKSDNHPVNLKISGAEQDGDYRVMS